MQTDGLFVIMCIVFIFAAWVATGGPSRPISQAGLFITPVTRPGEESQGYRTIIPANPIDTSSYPKQIAGGGTTISSGKDFYMRTVPQAGSPYADRVYLERSTVGVISGNPNQEYVTIDNSGTTTVTLSGWRLASKATGDAVTIANTVLGAGQNITIVSGRAEAGQLLSTGVCTGGASCIFLNRNLEMYAPSGETITLTDANGKVVDSFAY
ncbi:MAG: hypothetical protein JWO84_349 [Parcubacteria group bacterium]|nr:hypothetical protein [Parcubacteria group bacterium]